MPKLLHISASPRRKHSASLEVAKHFIQAYKSAYVSCDIEELNLWEANLPELTDELLDAAYARMGGGVLSPEQADTFKAVRDVIDQLVSADHYLISTPMWNFSIPYKLKHYVDLIVARGLTYSFSPESGYAGIVKGKKVVAVLAKGGAYRGNPDTERHDQQGRYLRDILGFIGMTDVVEICVEGTAYGPDTRTAAITNGKREAEQAVSALAKTAFGNGVRG